MQIRVTGVAGISRSLEQTVQKVVQKLADELYVDLRSNTPVKTGRAQRGWKKKFTNTGAMIDNQVPYIERLEAGASKQAPKGIIGPSLAQIKGKV